MEQPDNPRAVSGSNNPPLARSIAAEESDFALVTTAFLEDEYSKQPKIAEALIAEAKALMRDSTTGEMKEIGDDETKGKVASLIKRMRDAAKALSAFHSKEKQPYLRGGQAVDQFFFGLIDKLSRRDKKNRAGAADVLNDMLTDYDNRVLAADNARRQREADDAARVARERREEEERLAREAETARLAAERARNHAKVEEKTRAAEAVESRVDQARADTVVAEARAEDARMETLRKPADVMRTRGQDGTLSTVGTEKYAEVTDRTKLDKELLWPYIKQEAIESALTQWAKFTDYNQQMPGAIVGRRNKSQVR